MGKDKSSGNTYDLSNETFSFEKTKGNLEAIIKEYNNYVKGTTDANDNVANNINVGEGSAIDSPGLGNWLTTLWVSNATDAEKFSQSFTEWSNVVQHVMRNSSNAQADAESVYKDLNKIPELLVKYKGSNTGVSSSDVNLLTKTREAWSKYRSNWLDSKYYDDVEYNPSDFISFLDEATTEEKQNICERGIKRVKQDLEYHYRYNSTGQPKFDSEDPVTRMIGAFYLETGKFPEGDEATTLIEDISKQLKGQKNGTR